MNREAYFKLVILLLFMAIELACTCVGKAPPKMAFESSEAVMTGRIIGEPKVRSDDHPFSALGHLLIVNTRYKGDFNDGDTIIIRTGMDGGDWLLYLPWLHYG